MANLSSSTIMLTGAGGALATAVAQELEDAGAQLVLVGRGEALERAADRFPATEVLDLDLRDPASVDALRKVKVDALVHTVGAYAAQDVQKATDEDLRAMFDENMLTLFHAVQGVLPHMLRQKDGLIMGVSSGSAARMSGPKAALYTASKAAVAAYILSLHDELKAKGVRGCVLYPMGAIDTPRNRDAGLDWDRLIDPRGLAKSVAHALTRPDRAHLTELKIYPDA
ncbi:SDR family oxidoreductase [Deinococcus metallilatus]|uniref:NADP-dependent 3-hydroxy acid dehydrogenase YdfG n=1 Tax=Deinococcus metallilatus TaxID=1211322 RepID=A0AAJ5JYX6_9DEIO|nr:SDR family oxidoreductase [Deinococcus metallilatus]MBB5294603.1 NADP-dependent 3-hydroxy acid dehydrogenase YdfG [Deinococcus metallilatus]QBY07644.1 SDR family oxidoreductase [Deinococcus metallilatus]RXJ14060.1 SDR family oxidoreductase [Deinococcus metallilatus]TLK30025.1 SDR family oxidoreductase [Deinococcus metallilatus]GMA15817.1 short-chain dehydrogenase [Deinococcus metallilatus]